MSWLVILLFGCTQTVPLDSAEETNPWTVDVTPLEPPPEGMGFQLTMEAIAPPHEEVWLCAVYPLPTDALASVNWVEYQQNPGTHHLTLSTLGLVPMGLEPGTYPCEDLYAVWMEDLISIFGSQGEGEGTLHLPEGVAAQLPAGLDVVHEVHYVNAFDEPVELYSRLNAWTIPDDEVVSGIWGGQVRDEHIEIPPRSEHTEWSRCVMNKDVEVLFLASHTHKRGVDFTIAPFDGTTTGEVLYRNDDWHDPKITQYDPPMVVPAGTGFEYSCTYRNDTDETIRYGLTADDEMCNMAIVHTPFDISAACEVVATSDGMLPEAP